MYRKVSLSSFHNGKVEYCAIFGSGDIEENASVFFFYSDFSIKKSRNLISSTSYHFQDNFANFVNKGDIVPGIKDIFKALEM